MVKMIERRVNSMSETENTTVYMLTTVDNPYNPFTQWDLWYNFDEKTGHCSCGYLDRVSDTSDGLSEEENRRELTRAIDWIVKNDPSNLYRKVSKENFDSVIQEGANNIEEFSSLKEE